MNAGEADAVVHLRHAALLRIRHDMRRLQELGHGQARHGAAGAIGREHAFAEFGLVQPHPGFAEGIAALDLLRIRVAQRGRAAHEALLGRDRHPARHRHHVDALDEAGKEGRVDAFGDDVEIDEGEPVLPALAQGPVEVVVGVIPLQRIDEGAVRVLGIRIDVLAAGARLGGLDGERAARHLPGFEDAHRAVGEQDLLAVAAEALRDGAPGNVVAVDLRQHAQAREGGGPEVVVRRGEGAGHQWPPWGIRKREKAPAMARASCAGSLLAGPPGGPCLAVVVLGFGGRIRPEATECSSLVQRGESVIPEGEPAARSPSLWPAGAAA